jgi:hypothetical protein
MLLPALPRTRTFNIQPYKFPSRFVSVPAMNGVSEKSFEREFDQAMNKGSPLKRTGILAPFLNKPENSILVS